MFASARLEGAIRLLGGGRRCSLSLRERAGVGEVDVQNPPSGQMGSRISGSLLGAGTGWLSNGSFPLTPALSLGERENVRQRKVIGRPGSPLRPGRSHS